MGLKLTNKTTFRECFPNGLRLMSPTSGEDGLPLIFIVVFSPDWLFSFARKQFGAYAPLTSNRATLTLGGFNVA